MLRGIIFALLILPTLMFAGSSQGEKLVKQLFKDVQEKKFHKIEDYTASYFQLLQANGAYNKNQFMKLLKSFSLQTYVLSNFKETKKHGVIIETFTGKSTILSNGQIITQNGPRMTVWQKVHDDWKLISFCLINVYQ
jgi:hypothetical protein